MPLWRGFRGHGGDFHDSSHVWGLFRGRGGDFHDSSHVWGLFRGRGGGGRMEFFLHFATIGGWRADYVCAP